MTRLATVKREIEVFVREDGVIVNLCREHIRKEENIALLEGKQKESYKRIN